MLVYGDTNSTLAAALAAAKLRIPVAHVEAGLRSFDRRMPEEVNRVLADQLSSLLLCPSDARPRTSRREGIRDGVHVVGDVMVDVARLVGPAPPAARPYPETLGLEPGGYLVATVHRESNTVQPALGQLAERARRRSTSRWCSRCIPAPGPRSSARGCTTPRGARRLLPALGYVDFTALLRGARLCLTDSGGVQKEAYLHGVPCVTLRDTLGVGGDHRARAGTCWSAATPRRSPRRSATLAPPAAGRPSTGTVTRPSASPRCWQGRRSPAR